LFLAKTGDMYVDHTIRGGVGWLRDDLGDLLSGKGVLRMAVEKTQQSQLALRQRDQFSSNKYPDVAGSTFQVVPP
jgi:hypothetical protein